MINNCPICNTEPEANEHEIKCHYCGLTVRYYPPINKVPWNEIKYIEERNE